MAFVTLTLPWLTLSPSAFDCSEAGERAAEVGQWHEAIRHYETAADHPQCIAQRARLLHNAAMAAQTASREGTPAERCAVAERFQRVIEADPPADIARHARSEQTAAAFFCARVESSPPPLGPGTTPSPSQLITETLPKTPEPLPALTGQAVLATDDSDALLLGAAGLTAAGAATAYIVLWLADADRTSAQAHADRTATQLGTDRSRNAEIIRSAHARYDTADDRATVAGATAYSLLGLTVGLVGWWGLRQLTDDDEALITSAAPAPGGTADGIGQPATQGRVTGR